MSTPATPTQFGKRPLNDDLVIARFRVDGRMLAVERTTEAHEYLLAVDGRPGADVIASLSVSPAGEVVGYKTECRYATEVEIADRVRRSGWKILTYLKRRPPARQRGGVTYLS